MNGPEHYANAESDLDNAAHASDKGRLDEMAYWIGCAQVHATLALAAATAVGKFSEMPVRDSDAWQDTAGIQPGPEVAA